MFKYSVRQIKLSLRKFAIVTLLIGSLTFPNLIYAASSPWNQTDWSGGGGQSAFSDATMFDSSSGVDFSNTAGEFTLTRTSNWFNTSWKYRKQITFDNSAQAENLVDFPVLVKLTTSNFDYSKAQSAGQDLRFTDSNGTTSLPYEIESYNSSGDSFLWVKVPQINASSTTDSIYIYYGNAAASDGQSVTSVWNSAYRMVQHLDEASGINTADSTSNVNNGVKTAATEPNPTTGQINGAQSFDGINDRITVNNSASLTPGANASWTVSLWSNPAAVNQLASIISKRTDSAPFSQWSMYMCGDDGCNNPGQRLEAFYIEDGASRTRQSMTTINVADGNWHQYTMVADQASDIILIYGDGVALPVSRNDRGVAWPSLTNTDSVRIANNNGSGYYTAGVDEVRVSNVARSAAWIAASFKSEANTINTFGTEQTQFSASPGTLTSSIFDSGQASDWGTLTYTATVPGSTTAEVRARSSNSATMVGATAFTSCNVITSGTDISTNNCITDGQQYIQYQVTLTSSDLGLSSAFQDISISFAPTGSSSPSPGSSPPGPPGPSVCNDTAPTQAPALTKITSGSDKATLTINLPDVTYDSYAVNYGYDSAASNFGAVFSKPAQAGTVEQTIGNLNPATTYYFKVQLRQGCTAGPWSNTLAKNRPISSPVGPPLPSASATPAPTTPVLPRPLVVNSPSPAPSPAQKSIVNMPQNEPFYTDVVGETRSAWESILLSLNIFGQDVTSGLGDIYGGYNNFQNEMANQVGNYFNPESTQITQLKAQEIGRDYMIITWKTNHPATSKVSYGINYDYGQDVQSSEKVTEHRIKITGLKRDTAYFYEVMSHGQSYVFDARHEIKTLP